MLRFVDLFAGIGGIRAGFEIASRAFGRQAKCVFSSELDRHARETYRLNFDEEPSGDIRQVERLPEHDVLLAGFPCQAFSYAGKQKGFGDTRGTLFFEIERLLRAAPVKPRLLFLENVRGFVTHDRGRTFATVKAHLEKLGYSVQALVLNSSAFGIPQNRVRVYMVCSLGEPPKLTIQSDLGAPDSHSHKARAAQGRFFVPAHEVRTVADILEDEAEPKHLCSPGFTEQLRRALGNKPFESLHGVRLIDYRGGNSIHSWDMGVKGKCSVRERELMNAIIGNRRRSHFGTHQDGKRLSIDQMREFWHAADLEGLVNSLEAKGYLKQVDGAYNPVCGNMSFEVFKFLDPESISITVVSSDAHRLGVVQNGRPRRITPRECARLQGFPDTFKLHPDEGRAYHQLGNSVSVPVVSAIFADIFSFEDVMALVPHGPRAFAPHGASQETRIAC